MYSECAYIPGKSEDVRPCGMELQTIVNTHSACWKPNCSFL